jgi:cytidylate kinase
MNKKQIITIAGRPGSGKSTTAKQLATDLGYQHFSSGDLFRALGRELGIDVLQTNLNAEQNNEIDHKVDGRLREIGETEDQIIIDSRTAWHWIPVSFKVFLDLDLTIAAARILGAADEARLVSENMHTDPHKYAQILRQRLESETGRYKKMYDIDPYDMSNYDLVVDTEKHPVEEVVSIVLAEYRKWLKDAQ